MMNEYFVFSVLLNFCFIIICLLQNKKIVELEEKLGVEMSEKRFEMGESDIQGEMTFIDTETNKIYWQEYFDEIVDLVNEQQDTITALNEKIEQRNALLDKIEKALGEPIENWLLGVKYR